MFLFLLFSWYIDQTFRSRTHDWWRNAMQLQIAGKFRAWILSTSCGRNKGFSVEFCLIQILDHKSCWKSCVQGNMRPWLQLLELKVCAAKEHLDHTNWRKYKLKWVTGAFCTSTSPRMCCCRVTSDMPKFSSSVSPSILYFLLWKKRTD